MLPWKRSSSYHINVIASVEPMSTYVEPSLINESKMLEESKTNENIIKLMNEQNGSKMQMRSTVYSINSVQIVDLKWDFTRINALKDHLPTLECDLCDVLCIGCYQIQSNLIEENDTKLFLARHLKLKRLFMMEVREKDNYTTSWVNDVKMMRFMQNKKPSPFIVNIKDTLQTHGHILTVFEYMECGTLERRLEKERFDENQSFYYAQCMLLAIAHLHRLKVVHRNITLKCTYLSSLGVAKISDFKEAFLKDEPCLDDTFLKYKYMDLKNWAVCLQNMISGTIVENPDYDKILKFENQDAGDLLNKVFDRAHKIEKCMFVSKLPVVDVSTIGRIMKHSLFKSVNWSDFKAGRVISPDFHKIVIEKKVCPKEQWMEILEAGISQVEVDDELYLKEYLWVRNADTKLKATG